MKKKLFVFCSLLFFNVCVFAHTGKVNEISNTCDLRVHTEQVNLNDVIMDAEVTLIEPSIKANEATPMCTASLTKDGITLEVTAPCSKIVEAAKALLKTVDRL